MEEKYVCCVQKRECIRGKPLFVTAIAMNLASISKGLSPGEEWQRYTHYRHCWKRWFGCNLFTADQLPDGYTDITDIVITGYAEFMAKNFNDIDPETFIKNYKGE